MNRFEDLFIYCLKVYWDWGEQLGETEYGYVTSLRNSLTKHVKKYNIP